MNVADQSMIAYITIISVFLCPICAFVVYYYAESGFPWHTYITLFLGLYSALGILLLVPLDISLVVYDRRSTSVGEDKNYDHHVFVLSQIYNTYFTMVLILGSVILSFEEYYNTDGYFTLPSRLLSAFSRMCFDLFVPGVAGAIILGILIGKNIVTSNTDALKLTMVIITNTMNEAVLMVLLAYSLVEFPRSIWMTSDYTASLLKAQTKASHQFRAIKDAQFNVSMAVADVLKTKQAVASYADPDLNAAIDILMSECPPGFRADKMGEVAQNKEGKVTIDTLAKLRTRLNVLKDDYKMAKAKVEVTKLQAYVLEDLVRAVENPGEQKIRWSLRDEDASEDEYIWHMSYRPLLLKATALVCAGFSVLSFLGVVCSMQGVSNNVSPYFLTVHGPHVDPAGIFVFIALSFGYTVYITLWAIFEIKLGAAYELVPSQTTPEALSFNVRMVARLAAPLAFFYLGWISENGMRSGRWMRNDAFNGVYYHNVTVPIYPTNDTSSNTTSSSSSSSSLYLTDVSLMSGNVTYVTVLEMVNSTAISMPSVFSHFYQLQAIGPVQQIFGTLFPILLYVVLGLFLLNIFNRLLVCFKMDKYQFGTEIVTDEQLKEGKKQLERERASTIGRYKRERLKSMIARFTSKSKESEVRQESGGFFSLFRGKKETMNFLASGENISIKEPPELSGVIEKKNPYGLQVGSNWKEVYAEVRSPGYLHIYKDKKTADAHRSFEPSRTSDPQASVIDLTLVNEFHVTERRNKDNLELQLQLSDEKIKLKFKNLSDVERWRTGLQEWKTFALNYGTLYPYGVGNSASMPDTIVPSDVESGLVPNPTPLPTHRHLTNELENLEIEQDDQPLLPAEKRPSGGAGGAGWFGWGRPKKRDLYDSIFNTEASVVFDQKPASLEGWLEKKSHGNKVMGGEWQKRYVRIREEDGCLVYSKSSDPSEKAGGTIDLRLVKDIFAYEKGGKADTTRFNVDCGDKVYKFKARNEEEGQTWLDGLNAWRDYFVLH